jgi:NTE family protein
MPVFRLPILIMMLGSLLCKVQAQKVGVVLSGGGSAGVAHVGVLKALEENQIPIDFVTGTSMGALVGGMYAMGYSPAQIERLILSDDFKRLVSGKVDDRYYYFFRQPAESASWIGLRFYVDSTIHYRPPVNLISPVNMDFAMMEYTAAASAACNYNFDSLFVPFRCVAADIYNKQEVVFRKGDLGEALRASSSYPFYIKPVTVDNMLLFDGGLYNNFPADIMYNDFLPDVIIGSTVVSEMTPPREDDIYSQIKNMVMERTSYAEVCETENMLIIRPQLPRVQILDFSESQTMIDSGYSGAMRRINEIKQMVARRSDPETLASGRNNFAKRSRPLTFSTIEIQGLERRQSKYITEILQIPGLPSDLNKIRPYYYRLAMDDRISKIFPKAVYQNQGLYKLQLRMKTDNDLHAQFGGVFSSRPVNMGFIALRYKRLGLVGLTVDGNAYFGKFYSSAQVKTTIDVPYRLPFQLEADFTQNNFDFFNSASTFFEDTRPSYLIQYERSWNAALAIPIGNLARLRTGYTLARIADDYYQTQQFLSVDTADRTNFNHHSAHLHFEGDNMNRKQFSNSGGRFLISGRIFNGVEENIPGSTSTSNEYFRKRHSFFRVRMMFDKFLNRSGWIRVGLHGEAVISDQPLFNNYTVSELQAASFTPFPESRTLFMPNFRANQFLAGGVKLIAPFTGRLDLRMEAYLFQPYRQILETPDRKAFLGQPFEKRYLTGSLALVYNTPLAPVAISANYYQDEKKPFSIIFTVGYLIFNRKAGD